MSDEASTSKPFKELPSDLEKNLSPGEHVIDYLKTFTILQKPNYIILTNMRLIFFDEKRLGRYGFKSIPFQKLLQMTASRGIFFWGDISFKEEEGEILVLRLVSRRRMEGFIDSLKTAYGNIAVEPITIEFNKKLFGRATWEFNKPEEMLFRQYPSKDSQKETSIDPVNELKMRYVRGEITEAEYQEKLKVLTGR